ncbi:MAG: TIGR02300 family protein [Pseudomonadota bacterium]
MAKPELGTKRVCPETGRKFYDLNKDPIVSPYTGKSYPLSFFDDTKSEVIETKATETEAEAEEDEEAIGDDSTEVLSLDDADDEAAGAEEDKNLPDLGDNTDDEVLEDDSDDDTFLPDDDEDEGDDVAGIVDISTDDDD